MKITHKLVVNLGVGMALSMPISAFAQIEEVIVTAQKRSQSLQDVPIAMQALTGDQLEKYNADSAEDILGLLPNLSINGANEINTGFTIRGVGTNNFHGNVSRAVGIYQDEVSLSTPYSGVLGVYDIERVEVLRGPQNTLFGRNTTGGAINYISKLPEPGAAPSGSLKATYGSYNQIDVEAAGGLSLNDNFAVRAAVQSVNRDGLFVNLAPDREGEELGIKERISGRIQALWQPMDATSILFNYHIGKNDGTNIGNKANGVVADNPTDPKTRTLCSQAIIAAARSHDGVSNACTDHRGFNPSLQANGQPTEWKHVYNVSNALQDVEINGGFIKLTHEFNNGIEFTSISAIENTEVLQTDDNAGTNVITFTAAQDADYEQFSQEVRLASSEAQDFRWIGGFYYFKEELLLGTHVANSSAANGNGAIASNILDQEDEDMSVYGKIEYDMLEEFTLGAGLRYTKNEKTADSVFRVSSLGGPPTLGDPVNTFTYLTANPTQAFTNEYVIANTASAAPVTNIACNPGPRPAPRTNLVTGEKEEAPPFSRVCAFPGLVQKLNEVGGKVSLSWQPNDDALIYGSYARGFKSGGFDPRPLVALDANADAREPVKKETLDAFEIGYKGTFADGTLQLNAAAFYYLWKDLQTFATTLAIPKFVNLPESQLYGLDAELKWAPTDTWLITGGIGLLDTEITDVGNLQNDIDKGHELPNSPNFTLNATVLKDFPLAQDFGLITAQADVRYVAEQIDGFLFDKDPITGDPRPTTTPTDVSTTKESQFYLNLRLSYVTSDERYEVSAWAENLTEERFCNDLGTVSTRTFTNQCSPADGQRLFGVTAKVSF